MECLKRLILINCRAQGEVNFQQEWNNREGGRKKEKLEVVIVQVLGDHVTTLGKENWKEGDSLQLKEVYVPNFAGLPCPIECQDWVGRRFAEGHETIDWDSMRQTWWKW